MTDSLVKVTITPALMAEAFWGMESIQQIDFFNELAKVVKEDYLSNTNAYSLGELQWLYMESDMRGDAREILMAMAAPLYLNTLRFSEDNKHD
jgi:hypothetical protein